jgi:UTP-glucose-1-phosphate uridylyltransferase
VKAVVAVAGLGSRLLPASKEMPKKMFPIFDLEIKRHQ